MKGPRYVVRRPEGQDFWEVYDTTVAWHGYPGEPIVRASTSELAEDIASTLNTRKQTPKAIADVWEQLDRLLAALWKEHGYRGVVFGAIKDEPGADPREKSSSIVITGGPNLFGLGHRIHEAIRDHTP